MLAKTRWGQINLFGVRPQRRPNLCTINDASLDLPIEVEIAESGYALFPGGRDYAPTGASVMPINVVPPTGCVEFWPGDCRTFILMAVDSTTASEFVGECSRACIYKDHNFEGIEILHVTQTLRKSAVNWYSDSKKTHSYKEWVFAYYIIFRGDFTRSTY